jgi:very-short-patch-repair endonuclease
MRATATFMNSARRLRRHQSLPEQLLWRLLKQTRGHLRFRRQHAIGPYVADFYCPKARLVIEIDGASHDFTVQHDGKRDDDLRSLGLRVIRITAAEVLTDPLACADGLLRLAEAITGPSTTQPSG